MFPWLWGWRLEEGSVRTGLGVGHTGRRNQGRRCLTPLFTLLSVPKSKGRLLSWHQKPRGQRPVVDSRQRNISQCKCHQILKFWTWVCESPRLHLDSVMPCPIITLSSGTRWSRKMTSWISLTHTRSGQSSTRMRRRPICSSIDTENQHGQAD